ncbi:MAG: hypothetical protein JXB35_10680, partial [Anaerolineae bacterium]|nr:hypothetical protein [Anaerolineae bacterium]
VAGFIIDLVQGSLLIEVQTASFASIKRKLLALVPNHPMVLVYPIAQEKWVVKRPLEKAGKYPRRKSPKRGALLDLFEELVSFPNLIDHPNFSLDVALTEEEEWRRWSPKQGWRRKGWVIEERRLLRIIEIQRFSSRLDIAPLIPATLPERFTTEELAQATHRSRRFARKMAYCLRHLMLITPVGKRGNALLYTRDPRAESVP